MDAIPWLCAKAPGFEALSQEERDAIMHFALLWSLFKASVLGTHASAMSIVQTAKHWEAEGRLDAEALADCLMYFRDRHFQNNEFTDHFADLHFRNNDNRQLVETVLRGENHNVGDTAAALLIVVYRLRNNLFHGVKWAYELREQLGNFTNANALLMLALDLSAPWS
ncbi:MAG: hypothetical protein JWQ87_2293 [Candidatus Sulfotelmatobacter sp.]|nr:hypothetical protein [Candidatus Sulfotelmatobacter sp.]